MNEYDAQIGRQMSTEAEVTHAQAISDEDDLAGGLRGLSALVTAGLTIDDLLAAVAGFAAQAIPGADGAGVTLIRPTGTTMGIAAWSVTEPFVREIDIIQYETVQEGPCITCMQVRVAVVSGSLGSDHRWPRFGGRVGRLGVASSLSLPLLIADQAIGIIRARSGSTADEAFDRLRQISQTENTKLHEIARRVVDDAVRRARARHAEVPRRTP